MNHDHHDHATMEVSSTEMMHHDHGTQSVSNGQGLHMMMMAVNICLICQYQMYFCYIIFFHR